ncbi:TadE/TadG family type IV pilus assembly protein [Catellatospora chokoriensis]|uniref:TadE-like domain-containing protein n=1 Tax=Catellatospora chokoriensis TaxID=310353 RepID=A0A8J3NRU5_9ACTN|nr:TadE/TadG family type IV pilus assembly protein [Catellatospora chokoriensis]GIF89788.1 hypothetical protein Cch02nite_32320 [Catellatospora chokoriensis]
MTRPRRARDSGAVTVELAVAMPVLLLLILTAVQMAIWAHADNAATAAANRGVQAARAYQATTDLATAETNIVLAAVGGEVLNDTQVTVTRTTTAATVRITGHAQSLLPGLRLPVDVTVTAPLETVR